MQEYPSAQRYPTQFIFLIEFKRLCHYKIYYRLLQKVILCCRCILFCCGSVLYCCRSKFVLLKICVCIVVDLCLCCCKSMLQICVCVVASLCLYCCRSFFFCFCKLLLQTHACVSRDLCCRSLFVLLHIHVVGGAASCYTCW